MRTDVGGPSEEEEEVSRKQGGRGAGDVVGIKHSRNFLFRESLSIWGFEWKVFLRTFNEIQLG